VFPSSGQAFLPGDNSYEDPFLTGFGMFPSGYGYFGPSIPPADPYTGSTFGPIYSPPDVTPTFGPIYSPVQEPAPGAPPPAAPTTAEVKPVANGFVSDRNSLLGRLATAGINTAAAYLQSRIASRQFLPGETQTSVSFPGTGMPVEQFPARGVSQGMVKYSGLTSCTVARTGPSGVTRQYKGRLVRLPDGTIGCMPAKRRMSPCNANAARRAVRRLNMVQSFMRSIERSLHKTCAPLARRRAARRCGVCRKNPCRC
jgi:hypothetical protein